MNVKKILICLFFLILGFTNAQSQVQEKNNYFYVDFMPLITPPNRLSLGYMRKFNNKYLVGIELGSSVDRNNGRSNGNSEDYQLFAYRVQVGYIFDNESKLQHYISLDFQQIHHTEKLFDDYFQSTNLNEIGNKLNFYYDEINYKRKKMTFNFNYGFFTHFNKSRTFGLNPSFGIGVKFVDVSYSDPVNLVVSERSFKFLDFKSRYRIEGIETNLNINLQLKLFYKF